jgi:hypothetical protein
MAKNDAPKPVPVPEITLTRYVKERIGPNKWDVYEETLSCKVTGRKKIESAQTLAVAQGALRTKEALRIRNEALL